MEAVARARTQSRVLVHPLRVLLVVPRARGGLARHVLGLVRHLDRSRFLPQVVCPKEHSVYEEAAALDVEVTALPVGGSPLRYPQLSWRLASLIRAKQIDIVHAHGYQAGLIAAWAKRLAPPVCFICTFHGFPPTRSWRTRRALRAIDRAAEGIISVSQALKEGLTQICAFASPIVIIPNGIELKANAAASALPLPKSSGPLVGMIARFAPQKGIDVFIKAAHLAAKGRDDLQFVLVGDGPLRTEAERLRTELGLDARLQFPGYLPEVRSLIRQLDLLVIASSSEGSPLVPMEAMAEGKPIVATAAGGVPEVVANEVTGLLVPVEDPPALAKAMLDLLSDPEKAKQLGAAGRERAVREFGIGLMVEKTQAFYEKVFGRMGSG